MRAAFFVLGALTLLSSCASGPRARIANAIERGEVEAALEGYERLRASEGADDALLGRVAALVLEREASSADDAVRRAAVQQLSLAGTAGMPILERLARSEGPARLGALEALARRGRPEARAELASLVDSDDPVERAAAIVALDPEDDQERLLALIDSPDAAVRAKALEALRLRAADPEVLAQLVERARRDPAPRARAAAVRALGGATAAALEALEERLGDADVAVRMAAAGVLAADPTGRHALAPLLDAPPSPAGIEAARVLFGTSPPELELATKARAFLIEALGTADPKLRAQAATAFASFAAEREDFGAPLREALDSESEPAVRLALARALAPHDRAASRAALEALLATSGMPQLQAAALLAETGHAEARAVLGDVLAAGAPSILRRTAARALARDARRPDAVRGALADPDPFVRVYAAGGVLAATVAD